jgi:uncharacterized membrane protein YbhN (UPF0104 family)|tara:strand:+ start:3284 stop:4195 length:912 start_codon:yes stop_codon:yes gene_type:complete
MSYRQRAFQFLRYALLSLSVSLLLYLIVQAGVDEILLRLSEVHIGWLLLTFACMWGNLCSAALRYQCLLATRVSFLRVLEVIMASFLLNYGSMVQGLGLGAKVGILKARQIPVSQSSAGIWLEVCLDVLICSSIVTVFLFVAVERDSNSGNIFIIPLLFVLAASVTIAIIYRLSGRFELIGNFLIALREVASLDRLSRALIFTVGNWLTAAAGLYCMLNTLQTNAGAELGLSLLAMTSGFLTGLISMVPGGIGVRELTWSYVVSQGAYPFELAGLAAILYRILTIFLVSLTLAVTTLRESRES